MRISDWSSDVCSSDPCGRETKPLGALSPRFPASEARWRSGYAEDCKSLHAGSIPARASKLVPQISWHHSPPRGYRLFLRATGRWAAFTAITPDGNPPELTLGKKCDSP